MNGCDTIILVKFSKDNQLFLDDTEKSKSKIKTISFGEHTLPHSIFDQK